MSEYQFVDFRAIDGPVSTKNLEYMEKQSSRAEITPYSFTNKYHFGDFRGNAAEMLRRGYDFHLHYANFGIRKLMIRLPNGLPDPQAAQPYLAVEGIKLVKDKEGPGAILEISPAYEPGELDDLYDCDSLLEELIPLRSEIMEGDLRPLYLAVLGVAHDMNHDPAEQVEVPVPAGLLKLTPAQQALADLYGIDSFVVQAAAVHSPPLPASAEAQSSVQDWIKTQPAACKDQWLADWLLDGAASIRAELLNEYRRQMKVPAWPTATGTRTIAEIHAAAEPLRDRAKLKAASDAAKKQAQRLAKMASNPQPFLEEVDTQVEARSYEDAAKLLAELREALQHTDHAETPAKTAARLVQKHPTLARLKSALRKQNLVPDARGRPKK